MKYCDRPGCVEEAKFSASYHGETRDYTVKLCRRHSWAVRDAITQAIGSTKETGR